AGGIGGGAGGQVGGFCWVAREVYGEDDPRWLVFRSWLSEEAPPWLYRLYAARGEAFAGWLRDKPAAKAVIRSLMNRAIDGRPLPAIR
ncbi:MAG: hypothetical protein O3A18_05250, partial [Planctomycetota bacterium]|nr:hypothetical protein [Planctomycetota bacterium]